ncbi:unnamed protein product [Schistosoma turkestanicum]|nr:unnamed protein product [Schistosoma turkestanicum]
MVTNSNNFKMAGERSTSEQREPSILAKPIRPSPFSGSYRAASAENKHVHAPWAFNHSPQVLDNLSKNYRNTHRSSVVSLSSSSALSIDERFNGELNNMKSFEKFAHMGQPHVIALYNFVTGVDGDLEFEVGDIIMLEDIVDESWYKGRSIRTGAVGIFPMNHVEVRIPLTSGLFTNTQPKTQLGYSDRSKNLTNTTRIYSHPCFKKKPVPLPKVKNLTSPSSDSTESLNSQTFSQFVKHGNSRNNLTSTASRVYSTPLSTGLPASNLLPNRKQIHTGPILHSTAKSLNLSRTQSQHPLPPPPPLPTTATDQPEEPQRVLRSGNAPPIINSIKPRNQTAISKIAQMLQEKGIVSYRSRQMPSGAKHLYPGSHPLLVSSTPTSVDRLKSFGEGNNIHVSKNNGTENNFNENKNNYNVNEKNQDEITKEKNQTTKNGGHVEEEEQTSVKTNRYHSPLMVETVLSKLLPELNHSSNGSSHSNSSNKLANSKHTINPRLDNSKRSDVDRRHSTDSSYSTEDKSDITINTTNNNLSNTSNHVKHLSESNMHNGIKSTDEPQSAEVKSTTIVRSAKLFHNNSFSTSKNNNDNNTLSKRAYTITKPPEKLITSKAYINLSSSGKSPNINQVSTVTTTAKKASIKVVPNQQSPHRKSNHQYSLIDPTAESNHCRLIAPNDWLIVEHEQSGNESTGELHSTVGTILKCIDSNPEVCDRLDNSHLQHSLSSSSNEKWITCENWFGISGLIKTRNVRVIDNSNELAKYFETRPRGKALYTFDKETDEDLPLSPGEIVYLFEAIDENWYRGESANTGCRGMFPSTFIEIIQPL